MLKIDYKLGSCRDMLHCISYHKEDMYHNMSVYWSHICSSLWDHREDYPHSELQHLLAAKYNSGNPKWKKNLDKLDCSVLRWSQGDLTDIFLKSKLVLLN